MFALRMWLRRYPMLIGDASHSRPKRSQNLKQPQARQSSQQAAVAPLSASPHKLDATDNEMPAATYPALPKI